MINKEEADVYEPWLALMNQQKADSWIKNQTKRGGQNQRKEFEIRGRGFRETGIYRPGGKGARQQTAEEASQKTNSGMRRNEEK